MKNKNLIADWNILITFKEKRFVFQDWQEIGKGMIKGGVDLLPSVPQAVSDSFSNVLGAVAGILSGASKLVNKSAGLLIRGIDWADYGIDRAKHKLEDPGPPDKSRPELDTLYTHFSPIDGLVKSKPELQINEPLLKLAVEAHMKAALYRFKVQELEQFYQPGLREAARMGTVLNRVLRNRENRLGVDTDVFQEYQRWERKIASIKARLQHSQAMDPALKTQLEEELVAAQSEKEALDPIVSFEQNWGTVMRGLIHFPPDTTPAQYRPRITSEVTNVQKYDLREVLKQMPVYLAGMQDDLETYVAEEEKWVYVRDNLVKQVIEKNSDKKTVNGVQILELNDEGKKLEKLFKSWKDEVDLRLEQETGKIEASFVAKPGTSPVPLIKPAASVNTQTPTSGATNKAPTLNWGR